MTAAEPPDPYVAHDLQLRRVHGALLAWLRELTAPAPATTAEARAARATEACGALLFHHRAESTVLFPHLRSAGRLRSTDVAFLDGCERDHRALHALCERLRATATAPHLDALELARLARELETALAAHVADEEAGLAPDRLRTMITPEGLADLAGIAEVARARLA